MRYRDAIVLGDLEGKTHGEAARLVGCPGATLSTRLRRGRQMLARRLSRLGVLCDEPARPALSAPLVTSTIRVVAGQAAASADVAALAERVMKAMLLNRLKAFALVVAVGLLGVGAVLGPWPALAEKPKPPAAAGKEASQEQGPAEPLRHLEALRWSLMRVDVGKRTLHVCDAPAERTWRRHGIAQCSSRRMPSYP